MSAVAIVGYSGTGKSTSYGQFPDLGIQGLNPKETVVINVSGKDLPFKGWKNIYKGKLSEGGNYLETSSSTAIAQAINYVSKDRTEIKSMIIDDAQFTMAFEFMKRAKETGYGKFSIIGSDMNLIMEAARNTRKDLTIYFLWHPEIDSSGNYKMKTVGKMVDDYLSLEGLFTVILYTRVSKGPDGKMEYQFITNNDGQYPGKSPIGMFKDLYIQNDLGLVNNLINEYNK